MSAKSIVKRVTRSAASILIIGFCLGSCAKYVPAPLDPLSGAKAFSSRALSDLGLREYQKKTCRRPSGMLWTRSPTEAAAEYFQPDVAVAQAKAAAALAAVSTADTAPNPSLSFIPELGQSSGVPSPWVLGFSLDFPIETAGKRQLRASQARYSANSAALAVTDAIWLARSAARSALLEMEVANLRSGILAKQSADYDKAVASLRALMDAGEISRTDLLQTQALQSRAELDLFDAKRLFEASSAKLAAAIGVPASALLPYNFSYGLLEELSEIPVASVLRKAALTQRPDVLATLQDYAAADAALHLEIVKQYPDINLGPGYSYDQGQSKWALGIGINLPIDRNLGPIKVSVAKRTEAAALFNQAQAKASAQLDQALAEIQSARSRISRYEEIVTARRKEIAVSKKIADAGEAESLTALLLNIQLHQDEISLLDSRVLLHQSLGALEDAARYPLLK